MDCLPEHVEHPLLTTNFADYIVSPLGYDELRVLSQCGLTDRQWQCIVNYYFDGLSLRQAGILLGISKQAVWIHIKKAKKIISQKFQRVNVDMDINGG
jgi:predicted DNA-binding protein (UPF0251 family)